MDVYFLEGFFFFFFFEEALNGCLLVVYALMNVMGSDTIESRASTTGLKLRFFCAFQISGCATTFTEDTKPKPPIDFFNSI